MIRRIAFAGGAAAAALIASLSAAAPASAGSGASASCVGSTCSVGLAQFIHLSGNAVGTGSGYTPVDVPPPPCLWEPVGNARTGSNYVINASDGVDPGPSGLFDTHKSFKQAKKLQASPKAGEWYYLPVNPNASAAGQAECLKLPLYVFVLPGDAPPMPPIPGRTLAGYAYNHMNIPTPALTINPTGKGFVNLGTYVWQNGGNPGVKWVTAAVGDQSATVTARPGKLQISTNGPGTVADNCGRAGSRFPVGNPPNSGAGTMPDCGVLWRAPASGATVTATVVWHVTWTATDGTGGTLPPIRMQGQAGPIPINEIQSVNGN